jgi:hypothetical protein
MTVRSRDTYVTLETETLVEFIRNVSTVSSRGRKCRVAAYFLSIKQLGRDTADERVQLLGESMLPVAVCPFFLLLVALLE